MIARAKNSQIQKESPVKAEKRENTLKTVIIDVSKFNEGDSLEQFREHTSYEILDKINPMLCTNELFLITDKRKTADIARLDDIGFAGYLSEDKISEEKVINEFPDSLYLITSLSELTDESVLRMYQRTKNIPWKILETKRAIVREITLDDINDLYNIYSDEETVKYIENLYEDREDELKFTANYISNQYKYYEYGLWAVTSKKGELIGRAGIFNREDYDDPELGFVFERSMWGTGLAYEVCSAILDYAREEFGFKRFNAFTKMQNEHAKRFLKKLGFEYKCLQNLNETEEQFEMYITKEPS